MLLNRKKGKLFTNKSICNATTSSTGNRRQNKQNQKALKQLLVRNKTKRAKLIVLAAINYLKSFSPLSEKNENAKPPLLLLGAIACESSLAQRSFGIVRRSKALSEIANRFQHARVRKCFLLCVSLFSLSPGPFLTFHLPMWGGGECWFRHPKHMFRFISFRLLAKLFPPKPWRLLHPLLRAPLSKCRWLHLAVCWLWECFSLQCAWDAGQTFGEALFFVLFGREVNGGKVCEF